MWTGSPSQHSSGADDLHTRGIPSVVYSRDCLATWSTNVHSIEQGSQVYDTFLEEFRKGYGDIVDNEHCVSSVDIYQSERTIQVLEDMLRACILDLKGSWDEHLPLGEFSYNSSYHASIQMALYEALYGRPCRSPLCWTEVGESYITGLDLIRDTSEKLGLIWKHLLMAQSW